MRQRIAVMAARSTDMCSQGVPLNTGIREVLMFMAFSQPTPELLGQTRCVLYGHNSYRGLLSTAWQLSQYFSLHGMGYVQFKVALEIDTSTQFAVFLAREW
jgi:hypothetical protein